MATTATTTSGAGASGRPPLPRLVVPALPPKWVKIVPEAEAWHKSLQDECDRWRIQVENVLKITTVTT